jgi:hypothetical protein
MGLSLRRLGGTIRGCESELIVGYRTFMQDDVAALENVEGYHQLQG